MASHPPQYAFLNDGPAALQALLSAIAGAKSALNLLYYIYEPDSTGIRIREALTAAAQRGVAVRLLIDGFGSRGLSEDFFAPLSAAGGQICRFLPHMGRQYVLRNHQKMLLADRDLAIVGGFNIGDSYFDPSHALGWRDLGLVLRGPDVAQGHAYFDALWDWVQRGPARILELRRLLNIHSQKQGAVRWIFSGPGPRNAYAASVRHDLVRAHRLDMMMGYFMPPPIILRMLAHIARATRARFVLAGQSDHIITQYAARHSYRRLIAADAEVYEYLPRRLHAKLIVLDDIVYVGSANFDLRSLRINCEVMLRIENAALAKEARRIIEDDINNSLAMDASLIAKRTGFWARLVQLFSYWFLSVFDLLLSRRLGT